jgi:hypothetical protein
MRFARTLAALAALALSVPALAANTQVSPSSFKAAGKTGHVYGRSDGVFQEATTKAPYVIENGTSAGPLAKGVYETFGYGDGKGVSCLDAGTEAGTCAGNTALVPGLLRFGSGNSILFLPLLQQDIAPDMDATGLDISCDLTDNDGVELLGGGVGGASGKPYEVGADPAFYFCATIFIDDVSGVDDLHMGFREVEAATATFDNYTDLASIGVISGDITIETILNNVATVTTDTTDNFADDATKEFCIYVSSAGVVTYKVDDVAPTATAAYTLADGLLVAPFIHYLHATTSPDEIIISKWEVGYQE